MSLLDDHWHMNQLHNIVGAKIGNAGRATPYIQERALKRIIRESFQEKRKQIEVELEKNKRTTTKASFSIDTLYQKIEKLSDDRMEIAMEIYLDRGYMGLVNFILFGKKGEVYKITND